MVRSSRVVQPPVSGVPVAGATFDLLIADSQSYAQKRLTSWVEGIDVDTQVHRLLGSDSLPDLLDDTVGTNLIDFPGHNLLLSRAPHTDADKPGPSKKGKTLPRLITLGGDHTITLPLLRSINR